MTRGTCSVCGGAVHTGSSICTQCKGTSRGYFRHLRIRSLKDLLMYPVALLIIGALGWIVLAILALLNRM